MLKACATAFLKIISKAKGIGDSSQTILENLIEKLPVQIEGHEQVIAKLSPIIGDDLVASFNEALNQLGCDVTNFIKTFLNCQTSKCRKQVDYMPVILLFRRLLNVTKSITETLINCETATVQTQEAATVISLVFYYFTIVFHGINGCRQDILFKDNACVSNDQTLTKQPLLDVLNKFGPVILAVEVPLNEIIRKIPYVLTTLAVALNAVIKEILGFLGIF